MTKIDTRQCYCGDFFDEHEGNKCTKCPCQGKVEVARPDTIMVDAVIAEWHSTKCACGHTFYDHDLGTDFCGECGCIAFETDNLKWLLDRDKWRKPNEQKNSN